jgi:UDP-glucose 4-epimerase
MSKIALVTGVAGFIGSHLADRLLSLNYQVIGIDDLSNGKIENTNNFINHPNFMFRESKIQSADLEKIAPDCTHIFHLAGLADIVPSINNPENYFLANTYATLKIMEYAKSKPIKKIVYAASSSCYGADPAIPTSEDNDIKCEYPYALTKFQGEEIVQHFGKLFDIPHISLRLFNVYGPKSRTNGTYGAVMGVFLAQKIAGVPLTIVGNGEQKRDFIFINDVVNAFVLSAESIVSGEIFNIGYGKPRSVNELANLISKNQVNIPKRPGEPETTWANISKAKDLLGWVPKTDLESGIEVILSQIDNWKSAPVWTPAKIEEATKLWFRYLK